MDDVDAVQAQIARTMLQSGDWVTAHLDGIAYLEKSPLKYWMMAVSFAIFGVKDWAARIPLALSAIGEEWVIRYVPSSEPIPGGEKVHSRCPFRASSANVRP